MVTLGTFVLFSLSKTLSLKGLQKPAEESLQDKLAAVDASVFCPLEFRTESKVLTTNPSTQQSLYNNNSLFKALYCPF